MSLDHNLDSINAVNVSVPIGDLEEILDWCETTIGNRYKFLEDHTSSDWYNAWTFIFDNEQDMLLFVLRWK